MNEDFEKRSKAVFDNLRILVRMDPKVIFLGGSAIQALLKTPKRLSIDLDIAYAGDVQNFIKELEKEGYAAKPRKSSMPDFTFYNITKDGVQVKLDISKLSIPETEKHTVKGFEVLTPKLSYFVASKLSALAFGTVGRLDVEQQQILKDIFDINCILDLKPDISQIVKDWQLIVAGQNRLRKSRFSAEECLSSAQKAIMNCVDVTPLPEFFISQHSLGSFEDMLTGGMISRRDISAMAARALALSNNMGSNFYEIEKGALEDAKDAAKLEKAARELVKMNVLDAKQINAIKTVAPVSLMFLSRFSGKE